MARHDKGLVGRTALISVLTLVSRLLGYAREVLSAALFGHASAVFDAFITAWRIPNLFRRFLGEGALSTSFQTSLTRTDADEGEEAGAALFRATAWALTGMLVLLCVVLMGALEVMPDTLPGLGWAWLGADPDYVRELGVRLVPFVVLICLSALVGGALQVRGCFGPPAWAPAALNVVWIATLVVLASRYGFEQGSGTNDARELEMARFLAWGVLVSGALQLALQVPALRRAGFFGRGGPRARRGEVAGVLRRSVPLALGAAVYQINVMVDGLMAEALLPDGGPTLHNYANRVQQFPIALNAVAATSAVFPALQALGHTRNLRAVRDLHDKTHRSIAFVALPASLGLLVLATPTVAVSFQRGAFGVEGVERTADALRWLALALVPAGAMGLIARTYYAVGDFVTPVRVSGVMLVLNVGLNLVCVRVLGLDVDGLALATTVTSWTSVVALWPGLTRKLGLPERRVPLLRPLVLMFLAALAMSGIAYGAEQALHGLGRAAALFGAIAIGVVAYFALVGLMRLEECSMIKDKITARLRRDRT